MRLLYECFLLCFPAFAANLVHLVFLGMIVPPRLKHRWQYLLVALAVCLFNVPKVIWGSYSVQAEVFRLLALPAVLFALPLLCFTGAVWKRLLANLLLFFGQTVGDMLALYTLQSADILSLSAPTLQTFSESAGYTAIGVLGTALIDSGVTVFARSLRAKRFSGIYLPVVLIVASLGLNYYAFFSSHSALFQFTCIALGGVSAIFLLYYVVALEGKTELEQELQSLHYRMELEQAHYSAVEARREELAKIRHDINNQLATVRLLLQAGEAEEAQTMLEQLGAGVAATQENVYCAIPVVNAVLSEKEALCRREGIALRTELLLPNPSGIEPLHLCSILSNLLDNAIHACAGRDRPTITLSSAAAGDYLFLKTVNPSERPQDPEPGHGYGTKILHELSAKYDGSYHTSYENGTFTAVVSLLPREHGA